MSGAADYSDEMRARLDAGLLKARAACAAFDRLGLATRSATKAIRRLNRFLRPSRGARKHARRVKASVRRLA